MRNHIAIPFLGGKGTAGAAPRLAGDEGSARRSESEPLVHVSHHTQAFRDWGLISRQSCLMLAPRGLLMCPRGLSAAPDAALLPPPPAPAPPVATKQP